MKTKFILIILFLSANPLLKAEDNSHSIVISTAKGLTSYLFTLNNKKRCEKTKNLFYEIKIYKRLKKIDHPNISKLDLKELVQNKKIPLLAKSVKHYLKISSEKVNATEDDVKTRMQTIQYYAKLVTPNWSYEKYNNIMKSSGATQNDFILADSKNYAECLIKGETSIILTSNDIISNRIMSLIDGAFTEIDFNKPINKTKHIKEYLAHCDEINQDLINNQRSLFETIKKTCSRKAKKSIYEFNDTICKTRHNYLCKIKKYIESTKALSSLR